MTQFVHAVGKFLAERSHRGGNGVILVHCTHGGGGVGSVAVNGLDAFGQFHLNHRLESTSGFRESILARMKRDHGK